jgi:hypothetical protein
VGAHSHLAINYDSVERRACAKIHSPDRSYDSSDNDSITGDQPTHGDEDLIAKRQHLPSSTNPDGQPRFLECLEPTDKGVPGGVARGQNY